MLRLAVHLVHLPAVFHPPGGEGDGEADVAGDRAEGDRGVAPVEQRPDDAGDQQHLEQRRQQVEHRQAQHLLDAGHAALDRAGHAAGLPVQVEAQRQAVHVAERVQRHPARRALLHGGEHRVPQLAEAGGGDAQQAVAEDQRERDRRRVLARRQRVHRVAVDERDVDGRHLGQHQADPGQRHAACAPAVAPRPQIGQQRAHGREGGSVRVGRSRRRAWAMWRAGPAAKVGVTGCRVGRYMAAMPLPRLSSGTSLRATTPPARRRLPFRRGGEPVGWVLPDAARSLVGTGWRSPAELRGAGQPLVAPGCAAGGARRSTSGPTPDGPVLGRWTAARCPCSGSRPSACT